VPQRALEVMAAPVMKKRIQESKKNKLTSHRESIISKAKRNGEQIFTKNGIPTLLLSLSLIIRDITQAVLLSYCCEWMKDVGRRDGRYRERRR
jgi:hypothetical protein